VKPVKMWAVVRGPTLFWVSFSRPRALHNDEHVVRVLVTEVRKKKRGKRNGKA